LDLGLDEKKAIVCTAATDLGLACAAALAREGARVFATASDRDALTDLIGQQPDSLCDRIEPVVCDIVTAEGRATILAECPEPDILVNHAPGPPIGDFRDWQRADWDRALEANMLSAIELMRATFDGMIERGFGRIVNITSQSVRAPMANLDLSNAARAGLTGFVAGVARQSRDADVTINNLLPGMFVTAPLQSYISAQAAERGTTETEVERKLLGANPLGRLGDPGEFGASCAFLCSNKAGYINGQNILLDGGTFPGVM
jgi:3-oxoacyl-[acyl-carrier protein] reductase